MSIGSLKATDMSKKRSQPNDAKLQGNWLWMLHAKESH
jgi:hypothetical protein